MKIFKSRKTWFLFFLISFLLSGIGYMLIWNGNPRTEYLSIEQEMPLHYNGKRFAGSQSCIPCHESIYRTHIQTAHYNTSAIAEQENLKGNFEKPDNEVPLIGSHVIMEKEGGYHFQTNMEGNAKILDKSKIDLVIGSGVKGQSHLNFETDSLYQLPISYFTLADQWIPSPGFPRYHYKRPVTDDCIKCHVTFAKNHDFSGGTNTYDKNAFLYGVDCERCHGPLKEHVDYRLGRIASAKTDFVIKIDTLARNLQMDLCAQCHSGLRSKRIKGNPFSYVVGENLEDYTQNFYSGRPQMELDVHGNQIGLLKSSECYKNSGDMTCVTCHSPHKNQRAAKQEFNAKCLGCHIQPEQLHRNSNEYAMEADCIKCHMPMFPSKTMRIRLENDGLEKAVEVRTHLIGVYIDNQLRKRE